jgi:hypothetical protein
MDSSKGVAFIKNLGRGLIIVSLIAILSIALLTLWPGLGAKAARPLRQVIGNQRVAQLETILFTVQDAVHQGSYSLGLSEPQAPWQIAAPINPLSTPTRSIQTPQTPTRPLATPTPTATTQGAPPLPTETQPASPTPSTTASPTPIPWTLPAVPPATDLQGEGVWQPYLYNEAAEPVALRTFLLPDPDRPYATMAVIAFDLAQTNLHYVLGIQEPKLPDGPGGAGTIPDQDKQPNRLLAAFNGGFMASHGEYGAMSNGIIALPAKLNYGTIAILESGQVQIGEWGSDILPDNPFTAWRQNARMVIHNGQINDRVYNGSIITWGGNINGDIVTWRSGLGLSADQQTLYYFAGPSINMPSLAQAMTAVNVHNGILLDINATWVHFTAFRPDIPSEASLTAEPLFEEGMETNPDRYLNQSSRDFFYITTK